LTLYFNGADLKRGYHGLALANRKNKRSKRGAGNRQVVNMLGIAKN